MHLSGDPRYGQIDATPSWIHYLIYFGDCGTVGYSSLTMDKTPNYDGKLMIIDGSFERITVGVQIKTLPKAAKKNEKGMFSFSCDTKAMNCVLKNVTFNPVVLIIVNIEDPCVYYKLLTKEFVTQLKIGTQNVLDLSK